MTANKLKNAHTSTSTCLVIETEIVLVDIYTLYFEIPFYGQKHCPRDDRHDSIFVGNPHALWVPLHRTRKHSDTKTSKHITKELEFPLINVASAAQIPLLSGSVNRDRQSSYTN